MTYGITPRDVDESLVQMCWNEAGWWSPTTMQLLARSGSYVAGHWPMTKRFRTANAHAGFAPEGRALALPRLAFSLAWPFVVTSPMHPQTTRTHRSFPRSPEIDWLHKEHLKQIGSKDGISLGHDDEAWVHLAPVGETQASLLARPSTRRTTNKRHRYKGVKLEERLIWLLGRSSDRTRLPGMVSPRFAALVLTQQQRHQRFSLITM